ncbi:MAG: substrate-binding domain-containing protein [Tannerellaceae bacterium]|nr:substrate-binding domain-containing protein [Tannerellaceae bacterium]
MKNRNLFAWALLAFGFVSCEKEATDVSPFVINGITMENYPKTDGSTTTIGLRNLIACKLLGFKYDWAGSSSDGAYSIYPAEVVPDRYYECITMSKTHDSFIRLIDGEVDLIFTARVMSGDEKAYAADLGVTLIETPIALDAFIFITNPQNPVRSLSTNQIRNIYTGKVTNWKQVGGKDAEIHPYRRNSNSGSQELMESLVMKDLTMMDFPLEYNLFGMGVVYNQIGSDVDGLCYSIHYYDKFMVRDKTAKAIAVDGVFPDQNALRNKYYPYTTDVYAVIRSDMDRTSPAFGIYYLLLSEAGKYVIEESGYIPN